MVCDMDDHGINGDMKIDAKKVAAAAVEAHQEEKDISKVRRHSSLHVFSADQKAPVQNHIFSYHMLLVAYVCGQVCRN